MSIQQPFTGNQANGTNNHQASVLNQSNQSKMNSLLAAMTLQNKPQVRNGSGVLMTDNFDDL